MELAPAKPFKEYGELLDLLVAREMEVPDTERAIRKISQVGYYRLSGFWYSFREMEFNDDGGAVISHGKPKRHNKFLPHTSFDDVFTLYIFDKRLRLLLLDAIERIEVNIKTTLAHVLGKHNPVAYLDPSFIMPKFTAPQNKAWQKWSDRQEKELNRCKEDSIVWHRNIARQIPIWVAIEAWSFGTLSQYYGLLKASYKNQIAKEIGLSNASVLGHWLQVINAFRNRCAHHTRVWNQTIASPLRLPTDAGKEDTDYFAGFDLNDHSRKKMYGLIVMLWYLVEKVGPNSDWIQHIIDAIDNLPPLPFNTYHAMGIPEGGLDIDKFII